MPPDEREIEALEESLISFRLSGPNEWRSQFDQSDEEPVSSADSVVLHVSYNSVSIPCFHPILECCKVF